MEFLCLGPIEATVDGIPVDLGEPQRRLVLALLLAHANSVVSTDRLVDGIWGDEPPASGRKIVQGYVAGLRKELGNGDIIESIRPGYRLDVKNQQVDALRFEELAAEGAKEITSDPGRARLVLGEALALWRGTPYQDLGDHEALRPEIVRLEQLRLTAIENHMTAEIFSGGASSVVDELGDLCERNPLRERLWTLRMLALYRSGRPTEALRAYDEARRHLAEDVGLEPSAELQLVRDQILQQDPILGTSKALAATDGEPASQLAAAAPPSGTVTLFFTDIEGSTRLWEEQPEAMGAALREHNELLREAIDGHGGFVFHMGGDSFGAAFAAPSDALAAAIESQRLLHAANWPETTGPIRVRMALHTGEPESRNGDYLGPPVNRVARLMSAGHGGQILLSLATAVLVRGVMPEGTDLVELGEYQLKDLFRSETIFQVIGNDLPAKFPPLVTLDSQTTNLPSQATPFIGRERELVAVTGLLRRTDVRLTTLTGPGGIGKTRLCLQAAADLLDGFQDGVIFVDLARITESEQVPNAIASALGLTETSDGSVLATVVRSLHSKHLLLVLDNFEHVMDAAPVIGDLISGAPDVKIMTTSRESLRVYGEVEYPVPTLTLPDQTSQYSVSAIVQCEAVALFTQRAKAARPDFEVDDENARAVAQICTRLDGMPLAIELAAARVRLFEPATLLARLSDSLGTLTGGARDRPGRQQTIRDTIEWSYELLSDDEQVLFTRLGVFQDGRSMEATEAVCGPGLAIDVLDALESLLNKNLLRREKGLGGEPRFVMLETIHAFATERLGESGEADRLRRRHAEYFAALSEQARSALAGHEQGVWLDRLTTDYENLRKAMTWSLSGGDVQLGLRLVAALGGYWRFRTRLHEGQLWLRRALDLAGQATDEIHGQLLISAGFIAFALDDPAECKRLYEEALVIERKLNNQSEVANILIMLGLASSDPADVSLETSEKGLAIAREIGDKNQIAFGLNVLGEIYRIQGDYTAARTVYEEALPIAREIGHRLREAMLISNLGTVAFNQGDFHLARAHLLEAFRLAVETGDDFIIVNGLSFIGGVLGALGQRERAVRLLAASETQLAALGSRRQSADQFELDKLIAPLREQIDDGAYQELWAEGASMTLEDAIKLALAEDTNT